MHGLVARTMQHSMQLSFSLDGARAHLFFSIFWYILVPKDMARPLSLSATFAWASFRPLVGSLMSKPSRSLKLPPLDPSLLPTYLPSSSSLASPGTLGTISRRFTVRSTCKDQNIDPTGGASTASVCKARLRLKLRGVSGLRGSVCTASR